MEKYLLKENDIVIGMDGSKVGKNVSKISTGEVPSLLVQRVARLRVKEGYDQNFLYYHFFNNRFNNYVNSIKTGTSIPHISPKQISEYQVTNFPINEQKRVVSIIEPILEKIELNNQIIATLEELAATLFKRWFVDFEFPDENGNPYKSSGGKMVDSELGEIPEGWKCGILNDLFYFSPKETLKKETITTEIEMKSLGTSAMIPTWSKNRFKGSGTKFRNGDTILARITPSLENGKIGFIDMLSDNEVGFGSTEYIVIRSKENEHKFLSYFYAIQPDFKGYAIINMNGSSGRQRVKAETLGAYQSVIPNKYYLSKFNNTIEPIMSEMTMLRNQNRIISEMRNSLLPKLLSGEV